jgi:hypothetical protein
MKADGKILLEDYEGLESLLNKIYNKIKSSDIGIVEFSPEMLKLLMDNDELFIVKVRSLADGDFIPSLNLAECVETIKHSEHMDVRRVLEYCMLKNKIIEEPVKRVFKEMIKC